MVLGLMDEINLEQSHVELESGDFLFFYTDGVTEAMDSAHEPFGDQRLRETLLARQGGNAQEFLDGVVNAVSDFTNQASQSDDITLFVVRRVPQESG